MKYAFILSISIFILTSCRFVLDIKENVEVCGDNKLNAEEECDGTDLGSVTCTSLGYYDGNLVCSDSCTFDLSDCQSYGKCGDNKIQPEFSEECDGSNLNDNSCETLGYYGGILNCTDKCTFDLSDCQNYGKCGDGILQVDVEECDSENLGDLNCVDYGSIGGNILTCNADCTANLKDCDDFSWIKKANSLFYNQVQDIAVDNSGNAYITGSFNISVNFGDFTLTSNGSLDYDDMFIVKYDPIGNVVWAKQAGGNNMDEGYGIVSDSLGNIYVVGSFDGTALFDNVELTGSGKESMFIVKYDPDGNVIWAKSYAGTDTVNGLDIVLDYLGNIYVTGYFSGSVSFGSTTLSSSGSVDIFVAKYDSDGNVIWAKQAGGSKSEKGNSIVLDSLGNIYVTGYFSGSVFFGSSNIVSNGNFDMFIAKYDSEGNVIWAKQAGGEYQDRGIGVVVDDLGCAYVTGYFTQDATFDSTVITGMEDSDIFIAKYANDGNVLWVKSVVGKTDDNGYGIALDAENNVYVTGYFIQDATFDSTTLTNEGNLEVFTAKMDHRFLP